MFKAIRRFFKFLGKVLFNPKMVGVLFILLIAAAGAAYYFYRENQKVLTLVNNPTQASEQEVKELTNKVGNLMTLPSDEKPSVVTVVDRDKVKEQPFFAQSENGDKVLVYVQAKKAILYRPSTNKIIEVGPVETAPDVKFKVALYAGSASTSVDETEKTLTEKVTNLEVAKAGTTNEVYTKLMVIDVKGDKANEAKQLAELLQGEVSTLPAAETKPDADFMIIVGK